MTDQEIIQKVEEQVNEAMECINGSYGRVIHIDHTNMKVLVEFPLHIVEEDDYACVACY